MYREATHSGSWYSGSASKLQAQLDRYFNIPQQVIKGTRILIGPHAGYSYSGERLAETFKVWDNSNCKRIFILGPSHHVYFKNYAMISNYEKYETPLGDLPVDREVNKALSQVKHNGKSLFKYMSEEIDDEEHSFEMHCPFIYDRCRTKDQLPTIVPIMISSINEDTENEIVNQLLPYFKDETNAFVISSDFCHWGSRFGYTTYITDEGENVLTNNLISLRSSTKLKSLAVYESIEILDKLAMEVATMASSSKWKQYIELTGNTICGQRPIQLVLKLLELLGNDQGFKWLGYSQSGKVLDYYDSSVSYASGYV